MYGKQKLQELVKLADVMVQGSISETYRTCGSTGCRCHRGEEHGPHFYLTFRTPKGASTSLYVPESELVKFRRAVEAWNRFRELARELGEENRRRLAASRPRRGGSSADAG